MADLRAQQAQSLLSWGLPLALTFGAAQIIAGVIFFFAYNWSDLSDTMKIALPQFFMAISFIAFALLPKLSMAGRIAGIIAMMMIGVSMAVVGQVYQLGADPWRLFAIWAGLAAVISAALRDDIYFALTLVIASVAYFLYTDQELAWLLPQEKSLIAAIYTALGASILLARENLGQPPSWLRWLLTAAILIVATSGAIHDVMGRYLFSNGWTATLSLIGAAGGFMTVYKGHRLDKPIRAMALFAITVFLWVLGVQTIFLTDLHEAGGLTVMLFLSALWVLGVTWGFAKALRRFVVDAGSK